MAAEPARHRIELTCPECSHVQSEPALVVSTTCRACGENYQVKDGKAVSRQRPSTRFVGHRVRPPEPEEPDEEAAKKPPSPFKRPEPPAPPAPGLLQRLFSRPQKPRRVVCFDCGREHVAVPNAQSSQCPYCGFYISLRDFTIDERWNRRIQTRGDVVIEKGGSVSGVPITCHNLTVLGELAAAVECSGDLVILSHGKIPGKVRCHTLRVERGARVEFLHAVQAAEVFVDGQLTGQVHCTGAVVLEKRAELRGLVRAARLQVKQGAKHSGVIEIIQPKEEEEAPSEHGSE
ncbi:polymer-forming cytoskeletal protein [Luteolibacter sp. LG18]|uniref:bactofilin family protein n=1 Tax=Luteolibacter sp. LG18 TaxID=2819286 RepID=UPI002B2C99F8|nr:hypothetical protein llg_00480 [Luteolibacter sp. LG18]